MAVYDHIVVKDGIWYEAGAEVPEDVPVIEEPVVEEVSAEEPVVEKPARASRKK